MTARRANEISELIRRLGNRKQVLVDSAKARLSVIGARATEALIEALEGDNDRIRGHAMQLLALIRDPRGRGPIAAMLLDNDPGMRVTAAQCLARFPCRDSVIALENVLRRDRHTDVRIAAVHGLLEMYDAGREEALRQILALLFDEKQEPALRIAAFALLPRLKGKERRCVLKRLQEDPTPKVSALAAREWEGTSDNSAPKIPDLVLDLASREYDLWDDAVRGLTSHGASAIDPLVEEMCRRSNDPEFCTRAGMVLKGLGPRRCRTLADALERVDDPLPLLVLVEVIGSLGVRSLIYRFKDLIERLSYDQTHGPGNNHFESMQRVLAKAHLELAKIGSRVAIRELRQVLGDPARRLDLEILAAVELIGKKDEISDLLRAYRREDGFMSERISAVVRSIMRRERIRRNSVALRSLSKEQRVSLESILSKPLTRPRVTRRSHSVSN